MTEIENHPSKPLRKTRLFLKEVAIIVLGVGIALAAQQAVETWRERQQYLEAREAMRFELAGNLGSIAPRSTISACVRTRLTELSALLDKAEKHQPFTPPRWIGEASSARLRFATENEASRSGLFSPAEQRIFGRLYSLLHSIDAEQEHEHQAWARLQPLEGRTDVPPEMIANLREALGQARYTDERIQLLLGIFRAYSDQLGLVARTVDPAFWPNPWPLCLPMDTPRDEARRRSAYHMDHLPTESAR